MHIRARRDVPRVLAPVLVVGVVAALVCHTIIHHWRFTGKTADVVVFVTVFVAIGVLSYWFGRQRFPR